MHYSFKWIRKILNLLNWTNLISSAKIFMHRKKTGVLNIFKSFIID